MGKTNRRQILILLTFFTISVILYSLSVNSSFKEYLYDQSLEARDIDRVHLIGLRLKKQNYFLKAKFFKENDSKLSVSVFLNDVELKRNAEKAKDNYIKAYFKISGDILINGTNTLKFVFGEDLPVSIFANVSNFNKRLTKDIVLLSGSTKFPFQKNYIFSFSYYSIALIVALLLLYLIFSVILKSDNAFKYCLLCFLPFFVINFIFLTLRVFGYKIIMSPFMYSFLLLTTLLFTGFILITKCYFFEKDRNSSLRITLKNLKYSLLSCVIMFIIFCSICEAASRIFIKFYYPNKLFKISSNNDISYVLNSNSEVNFAGVLVKINEDGYRGSLSTEERNKDVKRIVFLGDSLVFGFGLNEEETLSFQLAQELNKSYNFEVLNLAITGHNVRQERLHFEDEGIRYSPDILIQGICLNDFGGNIYTPTGFNTLLDVGEFNYKFSNFSFPEKIQFALLKKSSFYQFLLYKWRRFIEKYISKRTDYTPLTLKFMKGDLDNNMKEALLSFEDELLKIKEICDFNNTKFVIIAYGSQMQLTDRELDWMQSWLEEFCREQGVYFLNLLPAFEGYNRDKVFIDEGHPSKLGNEILSKYLITFLKRSNLLGKVDSNKKI